MNLTFRVADKADFTGAYPYSLLCGTMTGNAPRYAPSHVSGYNNRMDALTAQTQEETRQIIDILCELTQLPSQWRGALELVPEADFRGRKPFACNILIDQSLALMDIRWSTLIHESLHALSVGYIPTDFRMFRGWEEGVVEQLQRFYRPLVLKRLQVAVEEERFLRIDAGHQFNTYIEALESLRAFLELESQTFYLDLLGTPIKDRPGYVFGMGNGLPAQARVQFIALYSQSNSVLKRSV